VSIDSIVEKAARDAAPKESRRRAVSASVKKVEEMLQEAAARAEVQPRIELGGSYAHDTWLEIQTDVDFFLVYPKEVERKRFEELGLSLAESALRKCSPRRRYAEHPYIEAEVGSVTVNAVPCYAVAKGEWKSAADRSPFHTRYMRERLDDRLKAQTRVLKLFLKAQGLYGAEIRIRGFSGYACEVLIVRYGSFLEVLRGASAWQRGTVVSVEGGEEAARVLFKDAPFVLLDPVVTTRNLGSAVSPAKLAEFIHIGRMFLGSPSKAFFRSRRLRPPEATPDYLKEHTLLLGFPFADKSEDILWGELWKSANGIATHLSRDGVTVLRQSVAAEERWAAIALVVSPVTLPKALERKGPEVFMKDATARFLDASRKRADSWWMGDDLRSHALFEGGVAGPAELLAKYMEDPVASVGFARGLAAAKGCVVLSGARAYASRRQADRQALAELVGYRF